MTRGGVEQLPAGTPLYLAVLDAADEFSASTFDALHGFYRPALGSLRAVLDLVLTGLCCELAPGRPEVQACITDPNSAEIQFGSACDLISQAPSVKVFEGQLASSAADTFFRQKGQPPTEGWVRRLYGMLSKYSHSRSGRTSGDIWRSNGPVYVPEAFNRTTLLFIEVAALMSLLVKLGRPSFKLPKYFEDELFNSPRVKPPSVAVKAYATLFG